MPQLESVQTPQYLHPHTHSREATRDPAITAKVQEGANARPSASLWVQEVTSRSQDFRKGLEVTTDDSSGGGGTSDHLPHKQTPQESTQQHGPSSLCPSAALAILKFLLLNKGLGSSLHTGLCSFYSCPACRILASGSAFGETSCRPLRAGGHRHLP